MERWQNKVAVVTGASSGIGAAIVKDLTNAGLIVIGLARRVERIEDLRQQISKDMQKNLHAIKCDVSELDSINVAFDWILKSFGSIDILVNNAGCVRQGNLCDMDAESIQTVVNTNLMGLIYCTQRAFKSMKERDSAGHIVLINSIAGHKVPDIPGRISPANVYSATKFGVTAITEILRQEFRGLKTKIKITSISPGLVDTEIVDEAIKIFLDNCTLKAEDISNAVCYALSTPPHVQIHELTIKPLGEII